MFAMDLPDTGADYLHAYITPPADYDPIEFMPTPLADEYPPDRRMGDQTAAWATMPTPPASDSGLAADSEVGEGLTISVSTAFYPGAAVDPLPPDLILASADSVFFYVHSNRLLRCSQNGFNASLPIPLTEMYTGDCPILAAAETSTVLNIVLHAIYDLPFEQYSPTSECLVGAVQSLHKYGAVLKQLVVPSTPLYQHLMSVAPLNPIDIYTIAAQFELEELAVATSSHLLSFSLSSISDEMAIRMGPLYLKRLFFLHLGRLDALKRILLPPPPPHPPTNACNFADQKQMVRVWALAVAYLAWDARPDLPITTIKQTLNPLIEKLPCNVCRSSLFDRTKNMIIQWSRVKNTI